MALKAGAPPEGCILDDLSVFKFWRIQKPNAAKLLKEIIFKWRGASAYVHGKPGKWVVWPRERWCEWTGLSRNQLDRALKELVESGLIHRERHRFAGSEVRAFFRPTLTALKHLGRPQDITQLVTMKAVAEGPIENSNEKASKKISDNPNEKINEKTDYTSVPSVSTNPTIPTSTIKSGTVVQLDQEGKGKDGGDAIDEQDQFDKAPAKLQANKKQKDRKQFPKLHGPHEKHVKHPSEKFAKWHGFSMELKIKWYARYLEYIENWKKGKNASFKNGIGLAALSNWTDEDEAGFQANMAAIEQSGETSLPS